MLFQDEWLVVLTYIYEVGTIIGIGILVFCIYLIQKIIKVFPGGNIVKKWRTMQVLLVVFIVLYIIDWIIWFYDFHEIIFIIGGTLRIGTAVMFGLILFLFNKTTQIILKKPSKQL